MTRYRATLAYDGSNYLGFQRQRDEVPTVQGVVEAALSKISKGAYIPAIGAGRTDTGVHATGQVIAFTLDWPHGEQALYRALNANLPDSIAITDVQVAPADFHPRFDAVRRAYRYTIVIAPHRQPLLRHRAWVILNLRPLNVALMGEAATRLTGTRDFGALGTPPQGDNTVRTVFTSRLREVAGEDGLTWVTYDIAADAFMYRMVRRTVGMLYDVGRGKLSLEAFEAVLASGRIAKGVTVAPPQGLVLTQVNYPDDALHDDCIDGP